VSKVRRMLYGPTVQFVRVSLASRMKFVLDRL
jgi:hypothetical protein